MKIGFMGLGKLGLPVATTLQMCGHEVIGYDKNPDIEAYLTHPTEYPFEEKGPDNTGEFKHYLVKYPIKITQVLADLVDCEIIFVAVQTPHEYEYEGSLPMPESGKDFDYQYLITAIQELNSIVQSHHIPIKKQLGAREINIVVISTVLPMTIRQQILPIIEQTSSIHLVYNPFFIAMSTVMADFLNPEFILIGTKDNEYPQTVISFYLYLFADFHKSQGNIEKASTGYWRKRIQVMSYESAELTKMTYNTFITQKITFANMIMEMAEQIQDADCDDVTDTLKMADQRLMSPCYLSGGMGDGGGCHPRDNIALSYLANKLNLYYNPFKQVIRNREDQARWLADYVTDIADRYDLPLVICGVSFKPDCGIMTGSPALLVRYYLEKYQEKEIECFDPYINSLDNIPEYPCVILIGCRHSIYKDALWKAGSVIIDPFRYTHDAENIITYKIGKKH